MKHAEIRIEPWTRLAGLSYAFEDLPESEQTGAAAIALVHAGHLVIRNMLGQRTRDEAMRALDTAQRLIVKKDDLSPKVKVRTALEKETLVVVRVRLKDEATVHYVPKAMQRGSWRKKAMALCGLVPVAARANVKEMRWNIKCDADTMRTCGTCNAEASRIYATVGEPRKGKSGRVIG